MGNKRKTNAEKECVTIRFKTLKSGNKSVYLDCYSKGERTYEFLKLYLVPETSQAAIDANDEVLRKAEMIRAERELLFSGKGTPEEEANEGKESVEPTPSEHDEPNSSFPIVTKSTILLADMVRIYGIAYEIKGSRTGYENSKSLVYAIEQYEAGNITLDDVDVNFCTKFIKFLKTGCIGKRGSKITKSTAEALYGTLSSALSMAVRLNFIESNPVTAMDSKDKVKREYAQHLILSLEQIRQLAKVNLPSQRHQVKEAFLFACYSGIKLTELRALKWKDMTMNRKNWTMHIAARAIDVRLTNDAMRWLPQRENAKVNDIVFKDLPCDNAIHYIIIDWMKAANLPEDITFGVSFHTYEHHNAKSRAQIKEETKDATRFTRWRLNKISTRAQQNVVEVKPVQQPVSKPESQPNQTTPQPKATTPVPKPTPVSKPTPATKTATKRSTKATSKPSSKPTPKSTQKIETIDLPIDALDALFGQK